MNLRHTATKMEKRGYTPNFVFHRTSQTFAMMGRWKRVMLFLQVTEHAG